MVLKIGLYGKNRNYLSKLAQCLGEEVRLQVFIFTQESQVLNRTDLDYLIVEEDGKLEVYQLPNREEVELSVDKYQSSKKIVARILQFLGISRGSLQEVDSMQQVIGVYSPASRAFKTSLAVILGYQQSQPTILISFDKFSLLNRSQNRSEGYDFSDLLYYLSQDNLEEGMITQAMDCMHELLYIYPPSSPEDIHKITVSQVKQFVQLLSGRFSRIILDIGNDISDTIKILKLCETIYLPELEDRYILEKNKKFMEYLQGRGEESLLEKIKTVKIPSSLVTKKQWDFSYYEQLKWCELEV